MKKLFVTTVILIILAAVAFGFGYVPLRLEAGERVMLFSKTSGWDETVFQPGEFAWRWELLIPRNATFYRFAPEDRRVRVTSTTALPSAELYRPYLDGEPPLEQEIRIDIRYRISNDGIAMLAPMGLDPESVESWYEDFDDQIRSVALRSVATSVERFLETGEASTLLADAVTEGIAGALAARFPEIEVTAIVPETVRVPDLALYAMGRDSYAAIQAQRTETLQSLTAETTARGAARDQRLETLARYGEILDRHPILLEYLEIAAQNDADPLNLQELQATVE